MVLQLFHCLNSLLVTEEVHRNCLFQIPELRGVEGLASPASFSLVELDTFQFHVLLKKHHSLITSHDSQFSTFLVQSPVLEGSQVDKAESNADEVHCKHWELIAEVD